jgi:Tol biopolymer transport system component
LLAYQTGSDAGLRQLTWFDRMGKPLGTVGEPRKFFDIEFSPDRSSLVASLPDSDGNYDLWKYDVADLWKYDVARGLPTRFTFDPAGEYYGVWSPDGRSVIFNSTRKGHYDLYRKSASNAGADELVYADDTDKVPTSWSSVGKFLLYFTGGRARKILWTLPLTPERPGDALKPVPYLHTEFNETFPQFSPDGQWVAYDSDYSKQLEIYVAPFSQPTENHQISTNGGQKPRWRRDGKEIFYVALDGQLMAAEIRISGDAVEVGAVRGLVARIPNAQGIGNAYDVSADGQRILAAVTAGNRKTTEPVTLVDNWTAPLKSATQEK